MKKIISCIFIFFIVFFCYSQNADEIFQEYILDINDPYDAIIKKEFGNLWCGFIKTDVTYDFHESKKLIEKINYYTKLGDKFCFLGCLSKDGLFDKNYNLLKLPLNSTNDLIIVGFSEDCIEYRFESSLVVYDVKNDYLFETESWANIWIDFENLTIKEQDFSYEK